MIIPFEPLWVQYKRIIKDNGAIVLTASQPFTSALVMSNINNFSHQWIWEKIGSNGNPLLANLMPLKNFEDVLVFYKTSYVDEELNHPMRYYTVKLREYTKYSRTKFRKIFGHWKFQHFLELQQQYSPCTQEVYEELTNYFGLKNMEGFLEYSEIIKIENNLPKRIYNPQMEKGKPYTITSGKMGDAFGGELGNFTTVSNGDRYPKSILRFGYDKDKLHPTQKPVALFEYLIKTYSNEGDLILDNCAGSFTTAIASENLKRNWICIEKEVEYCVIGDKRIKENRERLLNCLI